MADLGLLMADPLAQACAEGRKTVTRRPMSPQPALPFSSSVAKIERGGHPFSPSSFKGTPAEGRIAGEDRDAWLCLDWCGNIIGTVELGDMPPRIPGAGIATVGQRVWVRECWTQFAPRPDPSDDGLNDRSVIDYRADFAPEDLGPVLDEYGDPLPRIRWSPSVHMPKWAARTWGTLTSVTPCDLSDIDDAEAQREGFDTAAEFLAVVAKLYPGVRWFWRLEIEWDGGAR